MFCPNCGTQCPDGTKFCPSCSSALVDNKQSASVQQYFNQPDQNQQNCTQMPMYNLQPTMKWYKFLIYFGLFAGAVLNCISAFLQITGLVYGTDGGYSIAEYIYYFYPAMRFLDIVYGILLIALAALQVFTRFRLSGFKKNGPKLVITIYASGNAISILYSIIASVICGNPIFNTITVASIIISVVMIILNKVYFDKRKDMFVN